MSGHSIFYNIACAPSDLRSDCADDQSLRCPYEDALDPLLPTECPAKTVTKTSLFKYTEKFTTQK